MQLVAIYCPTEIEGPHIQDDVLKHLDEGWDMMIAHPPCTYLSNSGVRWLYGGKGDVPDYDRWELMEQGARFFRRLLDADISKIAVENPIIHKYAKKIIGRNKDQLVQPWQFGHGETKATCFWLKNLSKLTPTNIVDGRNPTIIQFSPNENRWKDRSRTYKGIADAMASQWG